MQIDLIVRGICALRPGLAEVSDNVRVRSVVGRYLEHSRIFSFENGGSPEVWLGSADWMPRNLRKRVEVLFPIDDPLLRRRLRSRILSLYLADTAKARELLSDGSEARVEPASGEVPLNAQEAFMRLARGEQVEFADAFADGGALAPGPEPAHALTPIAPPAKQKKKGKRAKLGRKSRAVGAGPLVPGGPVAGNA